MINTIKTAIKNKLDGITSIQEINTYERVGFEGNPAVNITVVGNEGEFNSTAMNKRELNFLIRVFIPLKGNPALEEGDNSKAEAEATMADVVDDILTAFDEDITLGRTVDWLRAAPSNWGYVPAGEGFLRTADINIKAIKKIIVR